MPTPVSIPIEQMNRQQAIDHLCGLVQMIHDNCFIEVFQQPARGNRPATLIGLEVKDKDAGMLLIKNLAACVTQIHVLPE